MFGSSPLVDAAENGELAAVKKQIEKGADVNSRGMFKITPLMAAVKNAHKDVIRFLLDHPKTDVNALNAGGTSALMIAARLGQLDIVKMLLADPRIDVNQLGKWGGTALMNAAGFGHIEIVREFLKIDGIRMDATYTDSKHSPLSISRQNGHMEVAALLEDYIAYKHSTGMKPTAHKPPSP